MKQSKNLPFGNRALLNQLYKCEEENHKLRVEINFLRSNPTIAKGMKGESLIAALISATIAKEVRVMIYNHKTNKFLSKSNLHHC